MYYGLDRVKTEKKKELYSCVILNVKISKIILPDYLENILKIIKRVMSDLKKLII